MASENYKQKIDDDDEDEIEINLDEKHPIIERKIKTSLKTSIREGSFSMGMYGFGTSYLSPYALALNATSSQIGILDGIASLLPSLVQLKASRLLEHFSRKKLVIITVLIQALLFIPLALLGLLFVRGSTNVVWIMIGIVGLMYAVSAISGVAWFSWMGSLVPEHARGKYFSRRNRITGFFGLIFMIVAALILDKFKRSGVILLGFGVLFSLAFVFRSIALLMFSHQYEPHLKIRKRDYFSLWQFLKVGRNTPFGRFTICTGLLRIATNIAGPFFTVYMLRDLGLSYIWFMIIVVSGTAFELMFYPIMGKLSDKFGNICLLRIAMPIIALVPFLWVLSTNPFYLIFVAQFASGVGWAGYNLATNNYIYDAVSSEKRGYGLTYFNLISGVGLFIGAGIGSLIALMNISFMNTMLFIFVISSVARFVVYYFFSGILKEVRHVGHFSPQYLMKEFHPTRGFVREIHLMKNKFGELKHLL